MSREAIRELQERRRGHVDAIARIDGVLRDLGAVPSAGKRSRGGAVNSVRSTAAKAMWAQRRKDAEKAARTPKVRTPQQRQRNAAHPVQAVSKPASLAAAAE